jgi:lipoprotein-anchoring transpeptidase ErfK/SrfK
LTSIDTTRYPNGHHQLRLRVVYTGLQYDEYFTPMVINNSANNRVQQAQSLPLEPTSSLENGISISPPEPLQPAGQAQIKPSPIGASDGYTVSVAISRNATRAQILEAQAADLTSLHTDAPEGQRWIEIDLSEQRLTAYQGDTPVMDTRVSTGKNNYIDPKNSQNNEYTETVTGHFRLQTMYEKTRMRGRGYDTPDVPWAMYFFRGFAIHGAYWHNDFGQRVSHGCINMRVEEAKQLFAWANIGTEIIIHE